MNIDTIDFLPPGRRRARRNRHRWWLHATLLIVLCASMGGWWQVQRAQSAGLRAAVEVYEADAAHARKQLSYVATLREEQARLNRQLEMWQRLSAPIAHGEVFATLAAQLPDAVVLTQLDVRTERSAATSAASDSSDGRSANRRSPGQGSATSQATPDRLEVEFVGIAPDDLTLANLLSALESHTLFADVKLHYSRSITVHGAAGRQFRIDMHVPLDRTYRPTKQSKEELAHVD